MRITALLQFTRLGLLLRSGRGSNAAAGEVKKGCAAREKPMHSTALLGSGWRALYVELAVIQLLLYM